MSHFKTIFSALVVSGAAILGASQASAMPMAPDHGLSSQVEQVRFGCGPGFHPNPWGRCVPNGPRFVRPYRPYRPMYRPAPRRHYWR